MDKLVVKLCGYFGVEQEETSKKWRVHRARKARALTAYLGKTSLGASTKELAAYLSVKLSGITYVARKGEEIKDQVDVNWLFELRPQ